MLLERLLRTAAQLYGRTPAHAAACAAIRARAAGVHPVLPAQRAALARLLVRLDLAEHGAEAARSGAAVLVAAGWGGRYTAILRRLAGVDPPLRRPKVFVVGLSRTGTTTLTVALRRLGYLAAHWVNPATGQMLLPEDAAIFDAMADAPVADAVEELADRYPHARFILTLRPAASWERSLLALMRREHGIAGAEALARFIRSGAGECTAAAGRRCAPDSSWCRGLAAAPAAHAERMCAPASGTNRSGAANSTCGPATAGANCAPSSACRCRRNRSPTRTSPPRPPEAAPEFRRARAPFPPLTRRGTGAKPPPPRPGCSPAGGRPALPRQEAHTQAMRDRGEYLFTSESVSEGHPDKVADRISDTVLDCYLSHDPHARVACETLVTTNRIVIAGEVRGPESVTKDLLIHLARMAVHDIGYEQEGFHWKHAHVECHLHAQSAHIAMGWTPPATRTRAPATRASCSAMPAPKPPN